MTGLMSGFVASRSARSCMLTGSGCSTVFAEDGREISASLPVTMDGWTRSVSSTFV